jgi:hypothetical protein
MRKVRIANVLIGTEELPRKISFENFDMCNEFYMSMTRETLWAVSKYATHFVVVPTNRVRRNWS